MRIEEINLSFTLSQLFVNLSCLDQPFWLDSALHDGKLGRYSFMGALPLAQLTCHASGNRLTIGQERVSVSDDPFEALEALTQRFQVHETSDFPFIGGAVGFLSYDLKGSIENLPALAVDDLNMPLMHFAVYDVILAFNHQTETLYLISHSFRPEVETIIEQVKKAIYTHVDMPGYTPKPTVFTPDQSKSEYLKRIDSIKAYIKSGDIYQANFTQRLSCDFDGDPLGLYLTLRTQNPAPFASFLTCNGFKILSCSPERFINVRHGFIETRPIKGTVKRGVTEESDKINREWLASSQKDHSELLMIVDLERNDLSKVCQVGSVKVPELFAIEGYATVYHLVSTVVGKLEDTVTLGDILRATFPGGSITGAPKIRAMEVIDSLENHARGIYTGSIGYIGFDGAVDLNIVIRTLVNSNQKLYFGVGGGIVWDSIAESEYEESLTKGKALMTAVGGSHYEVVE